MTTLSNIDFVDLVYEAAFDPAVWSTVLERFADKIGGSVGWLSQLSTEDGSGGSEADPMSRIDPKWPRAYIDYFAERNPLHHVDNPREYMRQWAPRILTDEDWMPREDLRRTEFYNDFHRPQDIGASLMVRLACRGYDIAVINIGRSNANGRFEQADIETAAHYHPHLIRAFELGQRFAATRRLAGDLAAALDRSQHGLFILSEDGRVRHANRAAERLAGETGGLRVVAGTLTAASAADARRLAALIGAAGAPDAERRAGGSMALATPMRHAPLSITVAPIRSERFSPFYRGSSILVCVTDLEANVSLPEHKLRDLFGLTPAETRLALALFEGQSPSDAAASFGVSPNTVRVQLGHVFDKTGANRQSELVRLMMRAVGVEAD